MTKLGRVLQATPVEGYREGAALLGAQILGHAGVTLLTMPLLARDAAAEVARSTLVFSGGVAAAIMAACACVLRRYMVVTSRDAVTKLATRAIFDAELHRAIGRARRHRTGFVLIALDLDGFKAINDTWGHPAGDAVLSVVAQRLLSHAREGDAVGRDGGDEFCLLLECIERRQQAVDAARRIRGSLESSMTLKFRSGRFGTRMREQPVSVGASIGVLFVDGNAASIPTAEELRASVDHRLKRDKNRRRREREQLAQRDQERAYGAAREEEPDGLASSESVDPRSRIGFHLSRHDSNPDCPPDSPR